MVKDKKSNDVDRAAVWVYTGDGLGIAGLPHRLSLAEAEDLQVLKAFEEAIEAGVYKLETKPAAKPEDKE